MGYVRQTSRHYIYIPPRQFLQDFPEIGPLVHEPTAVQIAYRDIVVLTLLEIQQLEQMLLEDGIVLQVAVHPKLEELDDTP